MGSPDMYAAAGRRPTASINFITCHDGFTLRDLYSYNEKHNLDNGENNNDGANDNNSWNCGHEGETEDPEIDALRLRMQKNALTLLFVSQGVPMISMGDECSRTQRGNNNAYCQDEEWNWFDWSLAGKNAGLLRFTKNLIAFRKANPALRQPEFLTSRDTIGSGYPDISWHGIQPWKPDWTLPSRTIAFMLCGRHGAAVGGPSHFIYCVFNMYHEPLEFTLPVLPRKMEWFRFLDTGLPSPEDIMDPGSEIRLGAVKQVSLKARSSVILIGK
jgi:glycogen operon protein